MRLLAVLSAIALIGGVARAGDDPDRELAHRASREHIVEGDRLRAMRRSGEAIVEYLAAEAAEHVPETLFAIGYCYLSIEQWRPALRYFDKYLSSVGATEVGQAQLRVNGLIAPHRRPPPPLRRYNPGVTEGPRSEGQVRYERAMQLGLLGRHHEALLDFRRAQALSGPAVIEYHMALAYEHLEDFDTAQALYREYLASGDTAENADEIRARIASLDSRAAAITARADAAEHDEWRGPRRLVGFGVSLGSGYHRLDSTANRIAFPSTATDISPSLDLFVEIPHAHSAAFQLRVALAAPLVAAAQGITLVGASAQEKVYFRGLYGGPYFGGGLSFTWVDDPMNERLFQGPDAIIELPLRLGWEFTNRGHQLALSIDVAGIPGLRTDGTLLIGALVEIELAAFITGKP